MKTKTAMLIVICILLLTQLACGTAVYWEDGWQEEAGRHTIETWQDSGFVCDQHGRNCTLPDAGGW